MLDGIRFGFKISNLDSGDINEVKSVEVNNHPSAYSHSKLVEQELSKQLAYGHYVKTTSKPRVVSPLGAIPKDSGDEVRLIHDGSRPLGDAMNDYSTLYPIRYQTLEDAYKMAAPGRFLAKIDLKSAYRSVPIHPSDYELTGIKWKFHGEDDSTYMVDTRLPFGARNGCSIFHRLSQSVKRMMFRRGYHGVVVYLDDFLLAADTYEECLQAQHELIYLLGKLGFFISWHKVLGPTQKIPFLGIVIDSSMCTLSLDQNKVEKLTSKLQNFSSKVRASKKQLQSLAGLLNWACQAVRGGRFFLRRVLDTIAKLHIANHKAKLSVDFHKDIKWWLKYLQAFNGVVYYRHVDHAVVHTDACNIGGGAFFNGDWRYFHWKGDLRVSSNIHINYKEVLAVVLAAKYWHRDWANHNITVITDSTVAKAIINRGTCKSKLIMGSLRELFWLMENFNFKLHAIHIPGRLNQIPDCISRLHEPGQLPRLHALINNWHHCNAGDQNFPLANHMSSCAFQALMNHQW